MFHMTFHKKDTSEKIKEATLTLLAEDGYDTLSMRKIAKEANVSLGQLTYYYATKDNLIVSVVKEVLDIFYIEFEKQVRENKYKIQIVIQGIESLLNEDTKIEKLLITIISQSQVNLKLQRLLREFWKKIIDLVSKCYSRNSNQVNEEESNIKARLLVGSTIESIVEKMLGVQFNENLTLIKNAANRLGECE